MVYSLGVVEAQVLVTSVQATQKVGFVAIFIDVDLHEELHDGEEDLDDDLFA